jgi:hypothetical protein
MASTEIPEDQLETLLDMGPRKPKPRPRVHGGHGPRAHGVSRELTLDPVRARAHGVSREGYHEDLFGCFDGNLHKTTQSTPSITMEHIFI